MLDKDLHFRLVLCEKECASDSARERGQERQEYQPAAAKPDRQQIPKRKSTPRSPFVLLTIFIDHSFTSWLSFFGVRC